MAELAKQYSIGSGIVEEHEAKILADLPTMYPDEGQRHIVEGVLLPHFRAELAKVFSQFVGDEAMGLDQPVVPSRLSGLCKAVDGMIEKNGTLLDLDGIFKPLMERVQASRREIAEALKAQFYQHCREILAGHGVVDRQSLLSKGAKWFEREDFSPYGKGKAFAGRILGRFLVSQVRIADLKEVSVVLGLPMLSNESKELFRGAFARHGVTDRQGLLGKGVAWFRAADFSPYGKGCAFAGRILGEFLENVGLGRLEQLADVLGLPILSDESKELFRGALARHGVTDRQSLLRKGSRWFVRTEFSPCGKGQSFAGKILGRAVASPFLVTYLEQIADVLGFEKLSREEELQRYCKALAGHGVTDRQSLLDKGIVWFTATDFSPYGMGKAFVREVLGRSSYGRHIHSADLNEIADVLWPSASSKS